MDYKHIVLERRGHVGIIWLNHPEKRNPLGKPVKLELMEALDVCQKDGEIRAVVLRGAGGTFSAGGDLEAMRNRLDRQEYSTQVNCRLGAQLTRQLLELGKPTIAVVEGAAAGSGLALALACDFQLVEENAKLVFSFVNIGYIPDSGTTLLVTRAVGTTRARQLLMSGRRFNGRQAADWGLMTEAVSPEKMENVLEAYLSQYANGPTLAYGYIKQMICQAAYRSYALCAQEEERLQSICEHSEDHKEAVYAFFDKRKPEFLGK